MAADVQKTYDKARNKGPTHEDAWAACKAIITNKVRKELYDEGIGRGYSHDEAWMRCERFTSEQNGAGRSSSPLCDFGDMMDALPSGSKGSLFEEDERMHTLRTYTRRGATIEEHQPGGGYRQYNKSFENDHRDGGKFRNHQATYWDLDDSIRDYRTERRHPGDSTQSYRTEERRPSGCSRTYRTETREPGSFPRSHIPSPSANINDSGVKPDECLYKTLGVLRTASADDIKKAFRAMSRKWHPDRAAEKDKVIASKKMAEINLANDVLSDTKSREYYDRTGFLPVTR
ncbi:hypothetical protein BKA66DRAFT_567944 [Pyrenochaeta sp. MPI-SDFR-AT-0127]|nr:hypothetical protein BKA66DRAFT_567944 [Pyrenochaeta sp. MPI-SDFR-AT-0127]